MRRDGGRGVGPAGLTADRSIAVQPVSAFQPRGAFAVIAAAFLNPLQAAVRIGGLVGVVLIDAGVHACLARGLAGILWCDGCRIHGGTCGCGSRGRLRRFSSLWCFLRSSSGFRCFLGRGGRLRSFLGSRRRCRGRRRVGAALRLAEIIPLLVTECARRLCSLIFGAAFLGGQGLRRHRSEGCRTSQQRRTKQIGSDCHRTLLSEGSRKRHILAHADLHSTRCHPRRSKK